MSPSAYRSVPVRLQPAGHRRRRTMRRLWGLSSRRTEPRRRHCPAGDSFEPEPSTTTPSGEPSAYATSQSVRCCCVDAGVWVNAGPLRPMLGAEAVSMSNLVLLADHPEGRLFWHAARTPMFYALRPCDRVEDGHVYKPDGAIHLCSGASSAPASRCSGTTAARTNRPHADTRRRCSGAPSPVSPAAATDATAPRGRPLDRVPLRTKSVLCLRCATRRHHRSR